MTRYLYGFLAVVAVLAAVFSYRTSYKTPALPASPAQTAEFGGMSLRLEYATTEAERERGLSGRENIPDDYGMLFLFPKDDYYGFWMKDMLAPIDIFWLNSDRHVVSITKDIATSTYPNVFYPPVPVRYVLETAAGLARLNGIATGTPLRLKNFPSITK